MAQDKAKLVFNPITGNFDITQDVSGLATNEDLNAHIDNTTDAHNASAISNIPSGNLSATDVQSALDELQTDIDTRALDSTVIKKNGSVTFTGNQSMGGFNLTGLASPANGSDAATKTYVDSVAIPSTQVTDFVEAAQDAVGAALTTTTTISLTYDDVGNTISSQVIAGSITNTEISNSATIDATKIANGSVSNVEFQYLDGVTSSIQTQLNSKVSAITGDINPTSFSILNGQATPSDVTGLAFTNGITKSFKALIDIRIIATSSLYELYEINGIQRGSDWIISQTSDGDSTNVVFSINSAGQVQYMSSVYAGFVSGTLKFKAHTIPV